MRVRSSSLKPILGVISGAVPFFVIFAAVANHGCDQGEQTIIGPGDVPPDDGPHLPHSMPSSCPAYTEPLPDPALGPYGVLSNDSSLTAADSVVVPFETGDVVLTTEWAGLTRATEELDGQQAMFIEYHAATRDGGCMALKLAWGARPPTVDVETLDDDRPVGPTMTESLPARLDRAADVTGLLVRGMGASLYDAEGTQVWQSDVLANYDAPASVALLSALGNLTLTADDEIGPRHHDCGCGSQKQQVANIQNMILADGVLTTIAIVICAISSFPTAGLAFALCMIGAIAFFSGSLAILVSQLKQAIDDLKCCAHAVREIDRGGVRVNCSDPANPAAVYQPGAVGPPMNHMGVVIQIPNPIQPNQTTPVNCCYYYPGQSLDSLTTPPCVGSGCGGHRCGEEFVNSAGQTVIQQCAMAPCSDQMGNMAQNPNENACEEKASQLLTDIQGLTPEQAGDTLDALLGLRSCRTGGGAPGGPGGPPMPAVACMCPASIGGNAGGM